VDIRTFERGDEAAQVAIYNEAAGPLPKYKPAKIEEVTRRVNAPDFDASMRFYAIQAGQAVAYVVFNRNGRVGFPWCRKGHEQLAGPLFDHMLGDMSKRGYRRVFTAYRGDWPTVLDFFHQRGFTVAREMVNFMIDIVELPTLPARPQSSVTPPQRGDVPALFALAPHILRCATEAELEQHLFNNPYFSPSSLFVLRSRLGAAPLGAGILIHNRAYADTKVIDASMPCFRLGAFGSEGMQAKRVNGLFSFLCKDDGQCGGTAVDLMEHASSLLRDGEDVSTLAAQVPSDAPNWLRFYQMNWRRQGSFPVLERVLAG
jgi:hypothetical protein